ncbi:MAG TPA: YbhB/YbcL family Raf kinase inhibitor-like protein [Bryobacteraceae bacterium]|nr:YbhB/YbcL family Raf kinase inhibitor-like protein [Bryobacteraceae bacterium]
MALKLVISAFPEGGEIPQKYTCEGQNTSPGIEWSGVPEKARSFALIVDDPDAPSGTFTHWVLFDVAAATHALEEGYRGGVAGTNDFGKRGYGGPCPPRGRGPHRYFFKLFALDVPTLDIHAGAKRAEVDRALQGHTIEETQYMGRFERK